MPAAASLSSAGGAGETAECGGAVAGETAFGSMPTVSARVVPGAGAAVSGSGLDGAGVDAASASADVCAARWASQLAPHCFQASQPPPATIASSSSSNQVREPWRSVEAAAAAAIIGSGVSSRSASRTMLAVWGSASSSGEKTEKVRLPSDPAKAADAAESAADGGDRRSRGGKANGSAAGRTCSDRTSAGSP